MSVRIFASVGQVVADVEVNPGVLVALETVHVEFGGGDGDAVVGIGLGVGGEILVGAGLLAEDLADPPPESVVAIDGEAGVVGVLAGVLGGAVAVVFPDLGDAVPGVVLDVVVRRLAKSIPLSKKVFVWRGYRAPDRVPGGVVFGSRPPGLSLALGDRVVGGGIGVIVVVVDLVDAVVVAFLFEIPVALPADVRGKRVLCSVDVWTPLRLTAPTGG